VIGDGIEERPEQFGLRHWMARVLTELERVRADFAPDPVHDLRVALRRCRSLAAGVREIDPAPTWPRMNRQARLLFQSLGDLRDVQVLMEWIHRLAPEADPTAAVLMSVLAEWEQKHVEEAREAIERFDAERWRRWADELSPRAERVPVGGPAYEYLAVARLEEAIACHRQASRNRTNVGYHRLRIAAKRFRYTVENFLPGLHKEWGPRLKRVQDLLGEVHDLDVLAATIHGLRPPVAQPSRESWREILAAERNRRIDEYRALAVGPSSIWRTFRAGLPSGPALDEAAMARIAAWAEGADPGYPTAERTARIAEALHGALVGDGRAGCAADSDSLRMVVAACLLHGVGRGPSGRPRPKRAARRVAAQPVPLRWSAENWRDVALLVRHQAKGLPADDDPAMCDERRERFRILGGILRVACALTRAGDGVRLVSVEPAAGGEILVLWVSGLRDSRRLAVELALARRLLEECLGVSLVIRLRRAPVRKRAAAATSARARNPRPISIPRSAAGRGAAASRPTHLSGGPSSPTPGRRRRPS
jgi:CHAD domain-containing protein